jgi:hypothetical protein
MVMKNTNASTVIGDIRVGEDAEGFTHIGDVNEHRMLIQRVQAAKARKPPLQDVILIHTTNPLQLELPVGYELLIEEEKAYNFVDKEKGYYVFLATTNSTLMLNWPVQVLQGATGKGATNYGMVDSFESSQKKVEAFKMSDLDDELKEI